MNIPNTIKQLLEKFKLKVVEKEASLLLHMTQDLLGKIGQHLCHGKIQSIKVLILTYMK